MMQQNKTLFSPFFGLCSFSFEGAEKALNIQVIVALFLKHVFSLL